MIDHELLAVIGKFVIYMVINTSGLKDSASHAGEVLYPTTTKLMW